MPYCDRCLEERPEGSAYCPECGFRLRNDEQPIDETPEQGDKMGEAVSYTAVSSSFASTRSERSYRDIWTAIGPAGKLVMVGSIIALIGFFIPTTRVLPPGLVVSRSLASIGGVFLLIPVFAITVLVMLYLSGQRRPLRNRLFIYATVIALGAFVMPAGFTVWLSGLIGGLVVLLGFMAIMLGGYGLMSDSTRSLV